MACILVTGAAGFIGSYVSKALLDRGDEVIALDNFNDYYVKATKNESYSDFKEKRYRAVVGDKAKLYRVDLTDMESLRKVFEDNRIDKICHLAAQAGVRYSIENPFIYERVNVLGTMNVFELAKEFKASVVFASSSSIYGDNKEIPFKEEHKTDRVISVYAATKKAGELLAHTYHHLYGMKVSCLRFFTVYGPWGRPDMAVLLFSDKILRREPITVYGEGNLERDFTFITDIVDGIVAAIDKEMDFEIINIGNNKPVKLSRFVDIIEKELGKKAKKEYAPAPPGDVKITYADITKAGRLLGFKPKVSIEEGLSKTIAWYKEFCGQ